MGRERWDDMVRIVMVWYGKAWYDPLAQREALAKGRRPKGEGANIDRRLVPYHGKCRRIQSRIEFIYLYIYLHICINRGPFCNGVRRLGTGGNV